MKKPFLIISLTLLLVDLVLWAALFTIQTSIRRFAEFGTREEIRIIAFREVSSGPAPNTRTIAIAEPVSLRPKVPDRTLASHILMSSSEVSVLRIGQTVSAITLHDRHLPATLQNYRHWFLTQPCLVRHQSKAISAPFTFLSAILLLAAIITGVYGLRQKCSQQDQGPT